MANLNDLVSQWNATPKNERHSFYSSEILPVVASALNTQYTNYLNNNSYKPYETLITTLSNDINIVLLLLKAIQPKHCVVFYTLEKTKLVKDLQKKANSFLESNVEFHFVEIDSLKHWDNIEKIKLSLKKFNHQHPPVLCDITGGKKIISTHIGIIAHSLKMDIAYLDSQKGFLQWGIPHPGYELLYIQKPDNVFTLLETDPVNSLRIRFIPETTTIEYEALVDGTKHRKLGTKKIKKLHMQNLAQNINNFYNSLNSSILHNSIPYAEVANFGITLKNLLFTKELNTFLAQNTTAITHLIIDEELHAIPWEIILWQCHVPLPLIRIPNREINYIADEHTGKTKHVAFITGSGKEIPDFDKTVHHIKIMLSQKNAIHLQTFDATNAFELQTFFAKHSHTRFSLVMYYGHATFGNNNEDVGLVCKDNSIFSLYDCEVLDNAPPECMLINACQSARSNLFHKNSFAQAVLKTGVETYIGTHFLLEFDKSKYFIQLFINYILNDETYINSFKKTIADIAKDCGSTDISLFNYVCYGY